MAVKYLKCGIAYYGRRYQSDGTYNHATAPIVNTWAMMDGDYFDIEVYNVSIGSSGLRHRQSASAYATETNNVTYTNNVPTDCAEPTGPGLPSRTYIDQSVKYLGFPGILYGYNYIIGAPIIWRVKCVQDNGDPNGDPHLEITMVRYNEYDDIEGPMCPPYNLRSVIVDSVQDRLAFLELADNEVLPTGFGLDVPIYQSFRPKASAGGTPQALTGGIIRRPPQMLLDDSCVGTSTPANTSIYSSAGLGSYPNAAYLYFGNNTSGSGTQNEQYRRAFHSQSNRDMLAQIERTIRDSLYEYGVSTNGVGNGRLTYSSISNYNSMSGIGCGYYGTGCAGGQVWAGPMLLQTMGSNLADTYWYNSILSIIAGNGGGPHAGVGADNTAYTNNLNGLGFDNSPGWVYPMASAGIFGFPAMGSSSPAYSPYRSMPFYDPRTGTTSMPSYPYCMKKWGDGTYCGSFSLWRVTKSMLTNAQQHVYVGEYPNRTTMPFMGMFNIFQRDMIQEAIRDRLVTQYLQTPTYPTTSSASNWASPVRVAPWYRFNPGDNTIPYFAGFPLISENCGIGFNTAASNNGGHYLPTGVSSTNLPYIADTLIGYNEVGGQARFAFPTGLSTGEYDSRRRFGSAGIHIASALYTGSGTAPESNVCDLGFSTNNTNKINCYVVPSLFSDWIALDIYGLERKAAYNNKIPYAFKWKVSSNLDSTKNQVPNHGFSAYSDIINSKKVTIYNTFGIY